MPWAPTRLLLRVSSEEPPEPSSPLPKPLFGKCCRDLWAVMKTQTIWVDGFQDCRGALGTENKLLSPGGPGCTPRVSLGCRFFTSTRPSGGLGCPARRGGGGFRAGSRGGGRGGGSGGGWQSCSAVTLPLSAARAGRWLRVSGLMRCPGATPVVLWLSGLTDTRGPEAVSGRASV